MQDLALDFEWPRATYKIVRGIPPFKRRLFAFAAKELGRLPPTYDEDQKWLVPTSKPKLVRLSRANLETTVRALIEMNDLPEEAFERRVILLSERLGLLESKSELGEGSERVLNWHASGTSLKRVFDQARRAEKGTADYFGEMGMYFVPDNFGKVHLVFRPTTLLQALIYTAATMKTKGVEIRYCQWCSKPFPSGGRDQSEKKIASAKFCSDKCRSDFHNARRRKV